MKLGIVYHMPFWRALTARCVRWKGRLPVTWIRWRRTSTRSRCVCRCSTHRAAKARAIRSTNVTLAPLPNFDGPVHFYPSCPAFGNTVTVGQDDRRAALPRAHARRRCSRSCWRDALGRPAFVLIVGDLAALLPTMPYRGAKRLLWRGYTAFEELNVQWMADRSLAFANGGALADEAFTPVHQVITRQDHDDRTAEIAIADDTCAG